MEITVILVTKRLEPRIDLALESLKTQTFKDFEYIIIDGFWKRRKDAVKELIEKSGISFPCIHIEDKPSRWKGKMPAICNARNTGLIFANGKYIVFCDDNCKMPPNWLEIHLRWLEKGYIVAGTWIEYKSIDNDGKGVYIYEPEYRYTIVKEPKIVTGGWLYGINFSFPLEIALDINGFDEYLDGELGQDDIDFGIRSERKGYKVMYAPGCCVEYYLENHGLLMNYLTDPTYHHRNNSLEFNLDPVRRVLKDGKEHLSNEFLIQELLEDKSRYLSRGNNFNLRDIRKIVKSINNIQDSYEELEKYVSQDKYDWRDNKLIDDKIKESRW